MSRMVAGFFIFLFLSHVDAVAAQQCPQGLAGMPNCIPPDHPARQHGSRGVPSGAVWEERWGAIAMGKNGSGFTARESAVTKRAATRGALDGCRQKGGDECKVIVHYSNQCAALVWGVAYWVTWRAPTVQEASTEGMKACSKETDDCRVMYSACSLPERIR